VNSAGKCNAVSGEGEYALLRNHRPHLHLNCNSAAVCCLAKCLNAMLQDAGDAQGCARQAVTSLESEAV
jgi:hypothetical protein